MSLQTMSLCTPIHGEQHILRRLHADGWTGDVVTLRALAERGDALRKRYENACSYQWATTDSYGDDTERLEAEVTTAAADAGLSIYLQGDCRGATVYVRAAPLAINDRDYSSVGLALYFDREA